MIHNNIINLFQFVIINYYIVKLNIQQSYYILLLLYIYIYHISIIYSIYIIYIFLLIIY
jgi:hypothetical protein